MEEAAPPPRGPLALGESTFERSVEEALCLAPILDTLPEPERRKKAGWVLSVLAEATALAGLDGRRLAREVGERIAAAEAQQAKPRRRGRRRGRRRA